MKRCSGAPSGQRAERAPNWARRGQRGFRGLSKGERLGLRGGEGQIPRGLCVQRGPDLLCGVSGVLARVGGGARPGKGVPGAVVEGLRHFLYAVPSHVPAGRRLSPGKREKSVSSHLSPHCLCGNLLPHPCGGDAGRQGPAAAPGSTRPRSRLLSSSRDSSRHGPSPFRAMAGGGTLSRSTVPASLHKTRIPHPFQHESGRHRSSLCRDRLAVASSGAARGCRVALQLCGSFLRTGASGVSSDLLEMHDFTLGPKLPCGRL